MIVEGQPWPFILAFAKHSVVVVFYVMGSAVLQDVCLRTRVPKALEDGC